MREDIPPRKVISVPRPLHAPRRARAFAAALLAAALLVVPAAADTHDACTPILDEVGEPTGEHLCTTQHWFTANDGKVGNVEGITQLEGESSMGFPSWDDTAPEASVTAGAGGGYMGSPLLDVAFEKDPVAGVTFDGQLTGNIDGLAFELYLFQPAANAGAVEDHSFRATVTVGSQRLVNHGSHVTVVTEEAGSAVMRVRFVVTDLHRTLRDKGDDVVHDVRVNVTPWFYGGDEAIYVYDTVEAPSSMIVNPTPEQLDGFTIVGRV